MKKIFLFLLLIQLTNTYSQSDSIYLPLEFQKAYENGTRSLDGNPGENYWQNRSDYKIKAEFDPVSRELNGEEEITYHNNSPHELYRIVIRLYQNIYEKGNLRDFSVSPKDLTDGVEITNLLFNDEKIDLDSSTSAYGTNLILKLNNPLQPNDSAKIEIGWNFILPKNTRIRMGSYDTSHAVIAYWYPQISVYDDIDGWDGWNYSGIQEFYNDFGNYDVEISVPSNYAVWATGLLKNASEILKDEYLQKYNKALTSDEVVRIIEKEDLENGNIFIGDSTSTWKFRAEYVPDFAFAVANNFLWDGASVKLDNGKSVFTDAAYDPGSKDFYDVVKIAKATVKSLSEEMPGVPFPYPAITVFNGSGGMEFPMIVNDGSFESLASTVHVTSHEIAHTYFPFYMGTNERKYAWMDEGWATMLPYELQMELDTTYDPIMKNNLSYQTYAGKELDFPMIHSSIVLRGDSYRTASYRRPGAAYYFLKDALGEEVFSKALKEYINRWNGKHPAPYDFFFTFNDMTGEDLNWFWKPWFFEFGYPDLAIKDSDGKNSVIIKKEGNIPVPVKLEIYDEDGLREEIYKSVIVWKDKNEIEIEIPDKESVEKIELGSVKIPDVNRGNNVLIFSQENSNR